MRECLPELTELAEVLGHEVLVAERDTDLYLRARRKDRLTLAAEMQWQLLPGRSCSRPEFELGAQLEPAYAIHGDNFDWSATADRLALYVSNGMGEGIEASLLTNLTVNALRNARRAGIPLADQAALADQAVYAHYRGRSHMSVLMFDFELNTGRARVVDAGSPQTLRLRDGVYAVASPKGEAYGDAALARAIQRTRLLPAADVPRAVLRELTGHRGTPTPDDDALVVCLDWRGR